MCGMVKKRKDNYYTDGEKEMFTNMIENAEAGARLRKRYGIDIVTQNNKWTAYGSKYECPVCKNEVIFKLNPREALLSEGAAVCDKCGDDTLGHWASVVNLFVN